MLTDILIASALTGIAALIAWYYYRKGFDQGVIVTALVFKHYDSENYEKAFAKFIKEKDGKSE